MSAIRARIWRYRAKWKSQGFCRYFGVTTSFDSDFDAVKAMVRRQKPDFLQVNYSLAHRAAEKRVIPAAAAVDRPTVCPQSALPRAAGAKAAGMGR